MGGYYKNVFTIAPSFYIKEHEIDLAVELFEEALKKVTPSVTKEIEKSYEELQEYFTKARAKAMQDEKPSYMG